MMKLTELGQHMAILAELEETCSPVVTCYANLRAPATNWRKLLSDQEHALAATLPPWAIADFEQAMRRVETFLPQEAESGAAGLALFVRAGESPLFLPLRFDIPMPDSITVSSAPDIYYLAELRDNYSCYAVLHTTGKWARIFGVNLGCVAEELRLRCPVLRQKSREWASQDREAYERERNHLFVLHQIRALERLDLAGGYQHLVLCGPVRATSGIRNALPPRLAAQVIAILAPQPGSDHESIIPESLLRFIEHEDEESQALVGKLSERIASGTAAVAGLAPSLLALQNAQAETLILARDYQPGRIWKCRGCGASNGDNAPAACPQCGSGAIRLIELKSELVRLAERSSCGVEIVNQSSELMDLGGVGCLLRYSWPCRQKHLSAA